MGYYKSVRYIITATNSLGHCEYDLCNDLSFEEAHDYVNMLNQTSLTGLIFGVLPLTEDTFKAAPTIDKLAYVLKQLGIPLEVVPTEGVSLSIIEQIGV